jgi:hypothetical protein
MDYNKRYSFDIYKYATDGKDSDTTDMQGLMQDSKRRKADIVQQEITDPVEQLKAIVADISKKSFGLGDVPPPPSRPTDAMFAGAPKGRPSALDMWEEALANTQGMSEFERMTLQSVTPSLQMREDKGITQSLTKPYEKPAVTVEELTPAPVAVESVAEVPATTGGGLMSKPAESSTDFTTSFVDSMGASEGTKDHVDHLGIKTLGYGILPATAKTYGFDPDAEEYKDRKVLAKAVYGKMYESATAAYPDVFKGLTDSQKKGTLSLYINLNKLPNGVVTALSKDTPDFDAAKSSLASVVLGSPRNEDKSRKKDANGNVIYTASKGLSKRRAKEYNILMSGSEDFKPVKTVSVEGTREKPTFVWKDADGGEVHRYTPSVSGKDKVFGGLDSSSSMKDVDV